MRTDWKTLKRFIDSTSLYGILNYLELDDAFYVWVTYENENFSCTLAKGSADNKDFQENYRPRAILKDDLSADGQRFSKVSHVIKGRLMHAFYVLVETSTVTNNDTTGYVTMSMTDDDGNIVTDSQFATYTRMDFEPPFSYEIYGGGLETIDELTQNVFTTAIVAPDIPPEVGGTIYNIRNKLILQPTETIFKAGIGTAELPYILNEQGQPIGANKLRIQLKHPQGSRIRFQLEVQYYA